MLRMRVLLVTVLLQGAGTWRMLTATEEGILHAAYVRALRCIVHQHRAREEPWTDAQVLAELAVPPIHVMITKARLAYVGRLARSGPRLLQALLRRPPRPLPIIPCGCWCAIPLPSGSTWPMLLRR